MNTILTTPGYDNFVKWMTNGQPRNMEGKPISDTNGVRFTTRTAPSKPAKVKASSAHARALIRANDLRYQARIAELEAHVKTLPVRPRTKDLIDRFHIAAKTVRRILDAQFGKVAK